MSRINSTRKCCKDVFNAFLVESASYGGVFEIPHIGSSYEIPNRLIPFSKSISCTDYDQWVHFYEDDFLFERFWHNPKKYLEILKKYNGVILPDFSIYRDMPLAMQIWNVYRSRALGFWLQINNIKVIANVRFGDKRTYRISCDGLDPGGTIAVGSHGTLKNKLDRTYFIDGLDYIVSRLHPNTIVVYGCAPDTIFLKYSNAGIKIIHFESNYAISHKEIS